MHFRTVTQHSTLINTYDIMDHINSKLRKFKIDSSQSMDFVKNIIHESPFVLAKRSANESLNKTLNYRAGVLRTVTTFSTIYSRYNSD